MTHTPGPWTLETVPTSVGICHRIGPFPQTGHQDTNYACLYVDNRRMHETDEQADELLANARLIAAAPDLLATLEALVKRTPFSPTPTGLSMHVTFDDVAAIQAVIAKARGQAVPA